MASAARVLMRVSSRSSFSKLHKTTLFADISSSISSSRSRRISSLTRLPLELSCLGKMIPLYTAIASARLNSNLSAESQSWGLIPQGLSMPL